MSSELRDSPFFGARTISFINDLLKTSINGSSPTDWLTPITDFEKRLLINRGKLVEINEELDFKLVELLRNAMDFIPPHTAMRLLLHGLDRDFLNTAYEIIYYATRDRLVLTDEEINSILTDIKNSDGAQVHWLMMIYADEKFEEIESKTKKLTLPKDFH